jgi:hypothetical protein
MIARVLLWGVPLQSGGLLLICGAPQPFNVHSFCFA